MRASWPLFLAAFLTDGSLYLAFAALPFRAIEMGAGPGRLGLLPTLYAATYMATAAFAGHVSDRVSRLTLARGAGSLFFVGCLALALAPNLLVLYAAVPLLGIALGFFWSPLQAELSDRAAGGGLSSSVGVFNVSWSLGKGCGLVAGGLVTARFAPEQALLIAGVPVLVGSVALALGGRASGGRPPPPAENESRAPVSVALLRLAWITNAVAFGVGSTMNVHAPKLLLAEGSGPSDFGMLVGAIFMVQTFTFAALFRHRPTVRTLRLSQVLGIVALAAFAFAPSFEARLVAAVPLGIALGLAYQASIHASLDRPHGRGRAAGLHETILGAGSSLLPMIGGFLAVTAHSLLAPFALGGVAFALAFIASAIPMSRSKAPAS